MNAAPDAAAEAAPDLLLQAPGDSPLRGTLRVPPDKSISHRVLLLAAVAEGTSHLRNVLAGADVRATLGALRALGVDIAIEREHPERGAFDLRVQGGALKPPEAPLDMGNSGTAMRLLAGLLCGQGVAAELVGDASLMRRPMQRIVEPLRAMGADLSAAADGCPPLRIGAGKGRLKGLQYRLPVASAQVKSAVLLAGLGADGDTVVEESCAHLSRDHTEILLAAQGVLRVQRQRMDGEDWQRAILSPGASLRALDLEVPGDFSSAAFALLAASLRPGSELLLPQVGINPTRTGFLRKLQQMGADIQLRDERRSGGEAVADLEVRGGALTGCRVRPEEVPALIDEVPALAVAAHFASGLFSISGAGELRYKEVDRLAAIVKLLGRLRDERVRLSENAAGDGFDIEAPIGLGRDRPVRLSGGRMQSGGDHRMAMAFAVAAPLAADLQIGDCACIATSYPGFAQSMRAVGLAVREVPA